MEKHELVVSLAAVFLLALLSNGLNLALSFVVITLCCVNDQNTLCDSRVFLILCIREGIKGKPSKPFCGTTQPHR
jgi:hypothetical protein